MGCNYSFLSISSTLAKPLLKSGYEWIIISQRKLWISLFIHALVSDKSCHQKRCSRVSVVTCASLVFGPLEIKLKQRIFLLEEFYYELINVLFNRHHFDVMHYSAQCLATSIYQYHTILHMSICIIERLEIVSHHRRANDIIQFKGVMGIRN